MPTAYVKAQLGHQLYYETHGKGEAILFIHGFGGSLRWWVNQKEFFEKDYQIITVDLPGHGQSAWKELSLLEMAGGIKHLLLDLGLHRINVVASSFGGLIALNLYRMMPEDISRISFVGSIPKFARSEAYPAGLDIENIRKLSHQFDGDYGPILDIFFRSLFTMKERESAEFKNLKNIRQGEPLPRREALKSFLDILEKTDLRDRLSSVVCPVQFITGEEDYLCPQPVMEWVQDHMPNARLDFIPGAGHLPFLTKIKEYNDLLENFLIN
jgi:pimeloyl-[acyl-carrier protein] methyl ester esterase